MTMSDTVRNISMELYIRCAHSFLSGRYLGVRSVGQRVSMKDVHTHFSQPDLRSMQCETERLSFASVMSFFNGLMRSVKLFFS